MRDLRAEAEAYLEPLDTALLSLSRLYPLNEDNKLEKALQFWTTIYNATGFTTVDSDLETAILKHPWVCKLTPKVREAYRVCEEAIEISIAKRILQAGNAAKAREILERGPIHVFYRCFVPVEWSTLVTLLGKVPNQIAILGSGALPETGFWVKRWANDNNQRVKIHHVELLGERSLLSQNAHQALGLLDEDITFEVGDVRSAPRDLSHCDAVWLNVAVGSSTDEKESVLLDVVGRMKQGSFVVTRSTYSLKTMAYPAISIQSARILTKLRPVLTIHSAGGKDEGVNSSVIFSRVL
ncbi:Nicotianamine synthase 2 [Pseudocercospora fuligena]|uniref:Nicotianamine synthase 2 n=1 Tax=Pseudocercospora fuligena TaxID=685502 RepID=A0A8H6RJE6_9PEZI|nr:Nicotianamine synthase 2 [Pseudocercospora fuligena]